MKCPILVGESWRKLTCSHIRLSYALDKRSELLQLLTVASTMRVQYSDGKAKLFAHDLDRLNKVRIVSHEHGYIERVIVCIS